MEMEIEFLGTGTSTGVPQIGCSCETCTSGDWRDKRLRASVVVRTQGKSILIDCGPDFRMQMLRASNTKLDALIITHTHYDHTGGIDDLRPYCYPNSFPVFARVEVLNDIRVRVPYCFGPNKYPGTPTFDLHEIASDPFEYEGIEIIPIEVMHTATLLINGYRIGDFAYITDAKTIDDSQLKKLKGVKVMVVNALRLSPHNSHFSLDDALKFVEKVNPERAYLTHMSHQMPPMKKAEKMLPTNVKFAYDGFIIQV